MKVGIKSRGLTPMQIEKIARKVKSWSYHSANRNSKAPFFEGKTSDLVVRVVFHRSSVFHYKVEVWNWKATVSMGSAIGRKFDEIAKIAEKKSKEPPVYKDFYF